MNIASRAPLVRAEVVIDPTPELRRAAEYHEGRALSDQETVRVVMQEVEALLQRWTELGQWIQRVEAWSRPKLSGIAVNNPSPEERQRRSAIMQRVWAEKRVPEECALDAQRGSHSNQWPQREAPLCRPYRGLTSHTASAKTRAKQSAASRAWWAHATAADRARKKRGSARKEA